jgi:3-oxoacyl-[acyl-carrier-protein] synthase III
MLLLVSGVSFAHAESTTTASSSTSLIGSLLQNVTDVKKNIEEKVTGSTEGNGVLKQATQKRIVNLAANISNRFDAIIWRFENISGRLQKRIDAEKASGKNVDAAQISLTAASTAIDDAKHDMEGVDGAVYDAVTSKDPKGDWQIVKGRYLHARTAIQTAHQALKQTITNLKSTEAAPSGETVSSSTPAT